MTLLYLTTVGAPYFIRAGMGQDFKNGPPLTFFGLLRGPLTLACETLVPQGARSKELFVMAITVFV
jgi:hypothetical protein